MKRSVQIFALPFLIVGLLLPGCDSGGSDNESPVEGTWENTGNVLVITSDNLTRYYDEPPDDCLYLDFKEDIIDRDGEVYTIANQHDDFTVNIRMIVDGDTLTLIFEDDETRQYTRSNVDVSSRICEN